MKPDIVVNVHCFSKDNPLNKDQKLFLSRMIYAVIQLSKMEVNTSIIGQALGMSEKDVEAIIQHCS